MKKKLSILMLLAALIVPWASRAQGTAISSFPWTCDFEDATENAAWSFSNNSPNGWYIGTAVHNSGTHAMYVSNTNGTSNAYDGTTGCVSYAYVTLDIASAGQYALQFDWKCGGEGNYDFLRVAVASSTTSLPTAYGDWGTNTVPSNFIAVDGGEKLNLHGTTWQTYTTAVSVPAAGTYRLIFVWRNDLSVTNSDPAAIDNVTITELTCPQPTALTVTGLTNTDATIGWTAGGSETEWVMSLNGGDWESVTNPVTLDTLSANTPYNVSVRAVCGSGDTSLVSSTSFRTLCVPIDSLPFFENFDGVPGATTTSVAVNNLPPCWNYHNVGTSTSYSGYPIVYNSSTYAHSGAQSMRFYTYITAGTYADQIAIMPLTDSTLYPVNTLMVSFWMRSNSTSYNSWVVVGVMTNPADASSFVPVETVYTNSSTTYAYHEVMLGSYDGPHGCVAFKFSQPTTGYNYGYVDDITLDLMPTCPRVGSLEVVHTTPDSIVVSWVPNGSETEWWVSDGVNEYVTNDTIFAIDNLNANTAYTISVRALCDADDTSDVVSITTRTMCTYLDTLPYTENFDGVTGTTSTSAATNNLPPCWNYNNVGTSTSYSGYPIVYNSSTYAHSGTQSMRFYNYITAGTYADQIAIMPITDPTLYPVNTLMVDFWMRSNSTSYNSWVVVGVMTNPADASSFVPVETVYTNSSTTYAHHEVLFGNYNGPHGCVAFKFSQPTSGYNYGYVDDITLDVMPTCPPIVSHHVTATAGAAQITWETNPNFGSSPDGYVVSYGFASDSLVSPTVVNLTDPELLLTGLTADTAYMVSIEPICTDGSVAPEVFTFTTGTLPCLEWDTTGFGGPTDTLTVGTPGTSTTNVMPINTTANYSYTQHLILASHIATTGPTNFSGIAFDYAYSQPMTHATNCQIYMGNTTRANFNVTSGSSTDSMFVPYSQLTLVYSGPLNCTTNGYNYFDFNQGAFAYDGTSNIVVAIVNNSGASNSSAIFRYEQTSGAAMSHRVFNSTTPYGPTEMDAARAGQSYWRTNMKLLTGGGTCLAQASCYAPAVTVEPDTAGDIEVSWIPGYQETAWDLDYQADGDTTWTSVLTGTTNTSHTIMVSSLLANTRYTFRVTANCSDTNIAGTANFTTPCSYISLPYNYGFEDMATGSSSARPEIPCWHHLNNGTTYYGYPYVYASAAHTGSRGLYWGLSTTTGSYGDYQVVVLPPVDPTINPANTLQLTFWAKPTSTSYAPVYLVGVMTDPTDVSTFQTVATVNVSHTSTDWDVYETSLGSYTGNGQYVAIRANRPSSAWYAYLDDVTLDLIPVCARVENVGATNITDSSATIYWDTTSSTEYDVQYGPTGFAVGSGTMVHVVDVDSLDIAGLTPNTAYDVYVRGNCPQDSGTWSFVYTFRTACVAFSVPYTEDFESYGTGSAQGISACWTKGTNSSTAYPYPYSTNAVTGSRSLYFYGYHPSSTSTTAIYSYAALPAFQEPINTLQLDFKVRTYTSTGAYYNTYLIVGVMGNPSDISTFVGVDTINLAGETAGSIHDISVSFSNYTGNGQYIAIYDPVPPLFGSTYNYSYAYVDDVTVDLLPACPRVEHLMASPMLTTATVSWEDTSSTNTSWYVEYDTVAFTPGTGHMTPIIVTDTFAVLNNLDSGTVYHVYVYPDCDTNVLYRHITFSTLAASPAGVPYFCDFETAGVNGWDFVNGTQNNYWMVGNATNNGGSRSMYITDNGTANSYSGAASYVFATRTFNLTDTGAYVCSYDWKAQGESSFDFLRVALVPASTQFTAGDYCGFNNGEAPNGAMPAGGIALDGGGRLNLQSSWQTEVVEFNLTTPGTYTMVFMWRNDPSIYNLPPAAIDNVGLMRNTCPSVSNVTVSNVTGSAATVQWTAGGSETEWEVSVNGNATIVSTPTTTLTGLSSLTSYSVKVRPICSVGDTGFAVSVLFTTDMCDSPNIVATGNPDSTTTTSYYAPVNNYYNYTLSETIIDSAELGGPMDINAITYYYNYTTAMTAKTDVNIYIQPTNKTAFSATSDIVALSSDAVLVYSGPLNCTQGWNTFGFITPYAYNGSGNLMVIVDDNSGDYDASSYTFKTQSTSAYKTIVYYSDSYNPDAATISSSYSGSKTYYQYRPVMQLISCGASCANPSGLHTTSVTYNSVEVVWSGTDSAEVGIHQGLWDETGATIATVTTSSYTFTGLTPNMQYTIAVRKLCEDNMTSDWVYLQVTTDDLPCFAPTNVQVSNETPSGAKVTWTAGGNETEWVVNVFRSGVVDTNYTVINTPMCNVNGLYSAMTYTVKVGAVCGGIDTMWSETTTFTTTACLPPTNVTAVANGHQAIVTWEGTGANEYHVLWFLQGFTTDGDSVIATNGTTNATIDGLEGGEDYDIYVYAYCDGQRSAQAGQTQLHVTGIDDINTSAINLYPNPANTTVTVDGIEGEALVTIVDMNGRTVFSEKTVSSITIDLGGMAKGAYFVRITGENSSAIRKLIVK